MRLRHITGSEEKIYECPIVIKDYKENKGKWNGVFSNENPIYIEIGMGKGKFFIENAIRYPDRNFIGIERYSTVLLKATFKIASMAEIPANLKFICMDASELPEVFEKDEVSGIYLNFSDPWPKDRHAKRRLPSCNFLSLYEKVLKSGGSVEFKTDNKGLFDFAMEELEPAGWEAKYVSYDLHTDSEAMKDNIMTEYEEKFSALGNPIYKYIIKKNRL